MVVSSIVSFVWRKAAAGGVSKWIYGNQKRFFASSCLDESCFPRISPWLMLPPAEGAGDLVYNLYSLAQNKVVSLNKRAGGDGTDERIPVDDADVVGSSKGWLTLYNVVNDEMFLSNPLSRRHVKLPSFDTLPLIKSRSDTYRWGCASKVIISGSPTEDQQGCRAVMRYGPCYDLAFCCPGLRSSTTEWTPIPRGRGRRGCHYASVVYSTRQQLFFCLKEDDTLEALDLRDPQSPRLIPMEVSFDTDNYPVVAHKDGDIKYDCVFEKFLIIAEESDRLFFVNRSIMERMDADGNFVDPADFGTPDPYKTISFDVHEYDQDRGWLRYMDGSLDGLAFFTGPYDGFALSAADLPELKPNSIYYTDVCTTPGVYRHENYGGHDLGIFDYEAASFSPCYYPCDVRSIKRIDPAPLWFTPIPL